MKSSTSNSIFNELFEFNNTAPQKQAVSDLITAFNKQKISVECEVINNRPRAKLSRSQADEIVGMVNMGRQIAQDHDGWTQTHLDLWDQYWLGSDSSNGIEHTLTAYNTPNLTLKQLLWCVNSITRTQSSKAVPDFVKQAVRTLREMEKEAE
jgi:hypothetical protein